MTNNNRDFMPEVGKNVFQEVKYVINAVGCNALGERGSTHTIIASTFLRLKGLLSSLSASRKIDK